MDLYWTNVSGSSEWENVNNWFTADPGGAGNPNGAAQATSVPWTQNDATVSANLHLSSGESSSPQIGGASMTIIGDPGRVWRITGTCDIPLLSLVSPYNSSIYDGAFSGDGFSCSGSYLSCGIYGGTFSGNGFTAYQGNITAAPSREAASCSPAVTEQIFTVGIGTAMCRFTTTPLFTAVPTTVRSHFTAVIWKAEYSTARLPISRQASLSGMAGLILPAERLLLGDRCWWHLPERPDWERKPDPGFAECGGVYAPILTVTGLPDVLGTGFL